MGLAGCGGGGSTASAPAAPTVVVVPGMTVPFQTAMANLVNSGLSKSFSLSGWFNSSTLSQPVPNTPVTGSGTYTLGTPTAFTFTSGPLNGTTALKVVTITNATITANNQTSPLSASSTLYFNTSNYTFLAEDDGTTLLAYSPYTYPTTVTAGDTGALGSATSGGVIGTKTLTSVYSVASDSANSLLVTITNSTSQLGSVINVSEEVYRITTTGSITPVSTTTTDYLAGTAYDSYTFTFL